MKSHYKLVAVFFTILFFVFLAADEFYGGQNSFSIFIKVIALIGLAFTVIRWSIHHHETDSKIVINSNPKEPEPITPVQVEYPTPVTTSDTEKEVPMVEESFKEVSITREEKMITLETEEPIRNILELLRADMTTEMNISNLVDLGEKYFVDISLDETAELLESVSEDEKTVGIWLLINKFRKGSLETKKEIFNFYNSHKKSLTNWNLVDLGARNILGEYTLIEESQRTTARQLASSNSVWDRRSLVMSTHPYIDQGKATYVFSIVELLINDREELVQNAIGWVLKELYKKYPDDVTQFIKEHLSRLSKQAVRIGTERMSKEERKPLLRGELSSIQSRALTVV